MEHLPRTTIESRIHPSHQSKNGIGSVSLIPSLRRSCRQPLSARSSEDRSLHFRLHAHRIPEEGDLQLQQELVDIVRLQMRQMEIAEISEKGAERLKRRVRETLEREEKLTLKKIEELNKFAKEMFAELEKDALAEKVPSKFSNHRSMDRKGLLKPQQYEATLKEDGGMKDSPNHAVAVHRTLLIFGLFAVSSSFGLSVLSATNHGTALDPGKFFLYIAILAVLALQLIFEDKIHGNEIK